MADTTPSSPCDEDEREGDEELTDVAAGKRAASSSSSSSSSVFLAELNLVMIVAFLTLSGDDLSRLEEELEKSSTAGEELHVVELMTKLRSRRQREPDAAKAAAADRRAATRMKSKILDSRHGRKM